MNNSLSRRVTVACEPREGRIITAQWIVRLDGAVIARRVSHLGWDDALLIAHEHLNPREFNPRYVGYKPVGRPRKDAPRNIEEEEA